MAQFYCIICFIVFNNMKILLFYELKGKMFMLCPNCSHHNDGGKFCERCGTPLTAANSDATTILQPKKEAAAGSADATTVLQPNRGENHTQQPVPDQSTQGYNQPPSQGAPQQSNRYIESTKKVSKMYFSYFVQVLKQPYASTYNVGAEHLINGIITMVLYAFLIPFTLYFYIKENAEKLGFDFFGLIGSTEVSFVETALKPTFAYAIFILLIFLFTFASVKLGRSQASFQEAIARFGSLLIPIVAILLISLIMSILNIESFFIVLVLALLGSVFLVPALVIASFKGHSNSGVDVIYGTIITYILIFITYSIMEEMFASTLGIALRDYIVNKFLNF